MAASDPTPREEFELKNKVSPKHWFQIHTKNLVSEGKAGSVSPEDPRVSISEALLHACPLL